MNSTNTFKKSLKASNAMVLSASILAGIVVGKFISWLIVDVIVPHIGVLAGGTDLKNLKMILQEEKINDFGDVVPASILNIGSYIGTAIDIIFIVFAILFCIKLMNTIYLKSNKKEIPFDRLASKEDFISTEIYEYELEKRSN